jgi:tungstate transport system substrate-binding protein
MYQAICSCVVLLLLAACAPNTGNPASSPSPQKSDVILATTTSTQDSGLLDVLLPQFERSTGYRIKPIAVGTGQSLVLGERGEADVVLTHAPASERAWMAAGNGTERLLVMHNDFVLVGPDNDPAALRSAVDTTDAVQRIANSQVPFVSRGDNSGTHQLEQQLWQKAGINPRGTAWYQEAGTGMGDTLSVANEKRAYTVTDRGTWLSRPTSIQLPILLEGDPSLLNIYHVMPVNPAKSPRINAAGGQAFAHWLVGMDAQAIISEYGKDRFGQPLFAPDAGRSESELAGS